MRVIITGATGFVGVNLVKYLLSDEVFVNPVSLREKNWDEKIPSFGTAIIHLAGKAHDTANHSSSDEYYSVNRDLTIKLFDFFLKSEIRDFFYFSSVKAAADDVDDVLLESTIPDPKTDYGKSKLQAENYLLNHDLPEGKRLFIIRPCMIHGPGNKGNLNLLYKILNLGLPWPLGAFNNQRSFLSIDNLCFLTKQILMNESVPTGIYQFADDGTISTNRLIELMGATLNKRSIILKIRKSLVFKLALIGDKIPFPLNSERLKKLSESYVVSNSKIKDSLGICELPIPIEAGLVSTIRSFKLNS